MKVTVIEPFRTRNGKTFRPGDVIEASDEKLVPLVEKGRVRPLNESEPLLSPAHEQEDTLDTVPSRLFSNGKPTGATKDDPLHIRVYAWCLVNLRFEPALIGGTDFSKVSEECCVSRTEAREAFRTLLQDGDLLVERGSGGRDIYFLAPIKG